MDAALKADLAERFPRWHVWEHVGGGLWYAGLLRCSPPLVAGPVPLPGLGDAIVAALEDRAARRAKAGRMPG